MAMAGISEMAKKKAMGSSASASPAAGMAAKIAFKKKPKTPSGNSGVRKY